MVLFLTGGWCAPRARARTLPLARACARAPQSSLRYIFSGKYLKIDFKIVSEIFPKQIARGDSRLKGNMYYDDFPKTRRRYTNFPNKGNYIGSDFPGQPKIFSPGRKFQNLQKFSKNFNKFKKLQKYQKKSHPSTQNFKKVTRELHF